MQAFRTNPFASLFPLLLAGFLAGMSYWLEITSRPPKVDNEGMLRNDPDYIVSKFNIKRFNETGELQHTFIADEMRHFPKDDRTHITEPRLIYHRVPTTFITAREALVDYKGEHVELIREVRVLRAGMNGKPASELNTERLHSYPDDEITRSDVPVRIRQGNSQVTGNSLQSNNMTATHTLEGDVRGTFYRGKSPALTASHAPPQAAISPHPAGPSRAPAAMPSARTKSKPVNNATAKPAPATAKLQGKPPVKAKPQAKSPSRSKPPAKTNAQAKH